MQFRNHSWFNDDDEWAINIFMPAKSSKWLHDELW